MNKELEETIDFLKKMSKEYHIFGDLDNPDFEDTEKIYNNLDIVLNYIDNSISKQKVKDIIRNERNIIFSLIRLKEDDSIDKRLNMLNRLEKELLK